MDGVNSSSSHGRGLKSVFTLYAGRSTLGIRFVGASMDWSRRKILPSASEVEFDIGDTDIDILNATV